MTEMMPEENVSPRQDLLENQIKNVVETFGQFDQGIGEAGAHYVAESPFAKEGLVCSSCVFFEGGNACEIVSGNIDPNAICKFWIIPEQLVTASRKETRGMKVTMNLDITAADVKARTLTGRILPFGEIGTPNIGRTRFLPDSVNFADPSKVKLNLEHDRTKPVGKATDIWQEGNSLMASFKISNTTAGNDVLVEAIDGLRDGFSVEIAAADFTVEDGVTVISKGDLVGVAVVTNPAFSSASIMEVAAAEETTEPATAGADSSITGENMDEVRPEAEAPVVEASAPAAPQVGLAFTAPRSPIVSAGSYLEHTIKAAQGNEESAMYVKAAADTTSTNTGLTLPLHLNEMISTSIRNRSAIDAISTAALPASGMSFTIPKFTGYPTVAETAEGAAPSDTGATSNYMTVNVKKYAGQQTISWELLDRSSPAFYDELMRELQTAYANATDAAVIAAFTASGTQATGVAATALGLQSFIATESAAAYAGTGNFAKNLVASAGQWAAIMGYYDSTNRPLYIANQPVNAPGAVSSQSIVGQVLGTNLYVDSNIAVSGVVDESAFLVAPEAATWYESPKVDVRVQVIGNGELQIGLYGYGAIAVKKAAGIRRFNLA